MPIKFERVLGVVQAYRGQLGGAPELVDNYVEAEVILDQDVVVQVAFVDSLRASLQRFRLHIGQAMVCEWTHRGGFTLAPLGWDQRQLDELLAAMQRLPYRVMELHGRVRQHPSTQ